MSLRLTRALFPKVETYEDTLFHGCSRNSMIARTQNHFEPYTHSLLNIDGFCTSHNPYVIQAFGSGWGFRFNLEAKPLTIARCNAKLFSALCCLTLRDDDDATVRKMVAELQQFEPDLRTNDRDELFIRGHVFDFECDVRPYLPKEAEAFTMPSWENDDSRSESELVVLPHGIEKLEASIEAGYQNGEFTPWDELKPKLENALLLEGDYNWENFNPSQILLTELLA